ncbi:hypothetical protein RJ641_027627 [Dillenia turbinata]|uniref:Dicer-like protein 4 n=1 Tax=Dillenia turbinata TaxID=194707 RepID=A0AAN8VYL2_9MAGN
MLYVDLLTMFPSKASHIFLSGNGSELNELMEAERNFSSDSLCDKYLTQAASVLSFDCTTDGINNYVSRVEVLNEPKFSKKLLCLIGILSNFRLQTDMKCIIFVNRIVTARALANVLQNLDFLGSWRCDYLVGVHSGLRSMSRKSMKIILEKFRSGELNLLVATKVGEEGLDIQTCCLVIRFDLPETVSSFIQCRGRARMPQSEYAFLVNSGNEKELSLIENFGKDERRMNEEIAFRTSTDKFVGEEEQIYRVDSSGASISAGYSISLLHNYCSILPHDEYFCPKPEFYYIDGTGGKVCHMILPSNAPIHQVVSASQSSIEAAKKDVCLKACKQLHELGVLTDFLLPGQDHAAEEESVMGSLACGCSEEDEDARRELHEMLVPAVLKKPWTTSEHLITSEPLICLNAYYIKFAPIPEDRGYREFGLFLKAPLPCEAERMKVDLHLAQGRSVEINLVPSGVSEFDRNEILLAENFQEVCLKIVLDRSEFDSEFVSLGKHISSKLSSSTFYLLLPVVLHGNSCIDRVDWETIKRCLSSPIFETATDAKDQRFLSPGDHLLLGNGSTPKSDIVNSLVYVPYKKSFFFISEILADKNGYSPCNGTSTNHVAYFHETFDIQLSYPEQPLLQGKQVFFLRNLLHDRKQGKTEALELVEYFMDLPPELCQLKVIGFSKEIGSSLSLLPSIMHRLENLLVAIELKCRLSASFPEGAEVTADHVDSFVHITLVQLRKVSDYLLLMVLEALTTEKCNERFSLERLEVLGDAFLKFAVGRHLFLLHDALDEGQLTKKRSSLVKNTNLLKLATEKGIQPYIRDQPFEPSQFFALGRPCLNRCNEETESLIHSQTKNSMVGSNPVEVKCSKCHHWLYKKTIADVIEALIGAFIIDGGFKAATAFLGWLGIQVNFEATQVSNVCYASRRFLPLAANLDVAALENILGYSFRHKGLLLQAFVHPSYNKLGGGCYQRLEFLGDAVLDYLITSYLYSVYPKLKPGQLTDLRSFSVNNVSFASVAVSNSFHKFIICDSDSLQEDIGKYVHFIKTAPKRDPTEGPRCPKALGDLVESCIAAILLDTGFDLDYVWKIMLSFLDSIISFSTLHLNPVRELQELCQSHKWKMSFSTSKKGKNFLVEVNVHGDDICSTVHAINSNMKTAKRMSSRKIIENLKKRGYKSKSKSLEEVLRSCHKGEPLLIGFNESPMVVVAPDAAEVNYLMEEASDTGLDFEEHRGDEEPSNMHGSTIRHTRKMHMCPFQKPGEQRNEGRKRLSSDTYLQAIRSAKSRLHEICVANCWKAPSFTCCKEEGPAHLKLFTFKVVVEIDDMTLDVETDEAQGTILECFSLPRPQKKAAAEHAAEGAIWYLEQKRYC